MALAMSHPTWVRGLKLPYLVRGAKIYVVAPYVGAWIETLSIVMIRFVILSHPTWVRGLKLHWFQFSRYLAGRTLRGCVD